MSIASRLAAACMAVVLLCLGGCAPEEPAADLSGEKGLPVTQVS